VSDRNPYPYYQAKLEAERIVARGGVPYSIVPGRAVPRAHRTAAGSPAAARAGAVPAGSEFSAQPLAAGDDLAEHLVQL